MAQIVLGFGASHGPMQQTPATEWARLGERDAKDERLGWEAAKREAKKGIEEELELARQEELYEQCQIGKRDVKAAVDDANPDVVVVVSNPHRIYPEDNQAVFAVYAGETLPVPEQIGGPRRNPGVRPADAGPRPTPAKAYPGAPELAGQLMEGLIGDGFDIAYAKEMRPDTTIEHSFTIMYAIAGRPIPMVPFTLSRYLPNQATPARCYALGQALRRAIESWDSDTRVAIMASGGLSHQLVDEDLDRTVVDALLEKDVKTLCSLPRDRLNRSPGTPEILNWVALAGAAEPMEMTLAAYVAAYRSLAGTGHGIGFAYWK